MTTGPSSGPGALAGAHSRRPWSPATAWIAGGVIWWRTRLPNAWGVEPTGALPLASVASTAVIMSRFWHAIRHGLPDDYSPEA